MLSNHLVSRDLPFRKATDLPDVFTSYRKMVEPLREAPRPTVAKPERLPPFPSPVHIPKSLLPFEIPTSLAEVTSALLKPLDQDHGLEHPPTWPDGVKSAHPFRGGEEAGHERLQHLISSGTMSVYKDTRNGLLGQDFSTKLSAWLALGNITARQIHEYLIDYEEGKTDLGKTTAGYGKGENRGTAAVRFELLWRDYMRLCTRKFGPRLFRVEGFRNDTSTSWAYPSKDQEAKRNLKRFLEGTTGTGLIDASMRELYLTGYTSNRARQNVASFLAKHLGIDWRIGAEWYESMLADYDLSSNWGNWQYTAGVGNDPRGEARVFNPVKQAFDYDTNGEYVKAWVPELRKLDEPQMIFQAWKVPVDQRGAVGLDGLDWVDNPLKRIEFNVGRGRGRRGNGGSGSDPQHGPPNPASGRGRGGGGYHGRGRGGNRGKGGFERRGLVDRVRTLEVS
jgi:deoxyribodipyrimidine photo-lyase